MPASAVHFTLRRLVAAMVAMGLFALPAWPSRADGEIVCGETVSGELSDSNPSDDWTFAGSAGHVVTLLLEPLADDLALGFHMWNKTHDRRARVENPKPGYTFEIPFRAHDATYVFTPSFHSGSDGRYQLTVSCLDSRGQQVIQSPKQLELGDLPVSLSHCVSTATDTWFKLSVLGSQVQEDEALHVSVKAEDGAAFRHVVEVPGAKTREEEAEEGEEVIGGLFITAIFGEIPMVDTIYNTAKTVADVKKAVSEWNAQYSAAAALDQYKELSLVKLAGSADQEFLIHGRHEDGGKVTIAVTRKLYGDRPEDAVSAQLPATAACEFSA